jgi:hypothetical protein
MSKDREGSRKDFLKESLIAAGSYSLSVPSRVFMALVDPRRFPFLERPRKGRR